MSNRLCYLSHFIPPNQNACRDTYRRTLTCMYACKCCKMDTQTHTKSPLIHRPCLVLCFACQVFIVRKMATFCAGRRQHGLTAGFISWLHENLRYARPSLSFAPDNGGSRNKIKVAETQYEHSKTCLQFLILLLYSEKLCYYSLTQADN